MNSVYVTVVLAVWIQGVQAALRLPFNLDMTNDVARIISQHLDQNQIDYACKLANGTILSEESDDKIFLELGIDQDSYHAQGPTHLHFGFSRYEDKLLAKKRHNYGRLYERAFQEILRKISLNRRALQKFASILRSDSSLIKTRLHLACPKQRRKPCHSHQRSPYRTADGSCNNLHHPDAGVAGTPFNRYLDPEYDDGVGAPKTHGPTGNILKSARVISRTVHTDSSVKTEEKGITLLVMQWGQFLDHDITRTPMLAGEGSSEIKCCKSDFKPINPYELHKLGLTQDELDRRLKHREACFPIVIPPGDPYFKTTCMNFVRSLPATPSKCSLAPREQQNDITAYIDASNVYGSTDEETRSLRVLSEGLLRYSERPDGSHYLPKDVNGNSPCAKEKASHWCFEGGDSRCNEMITLVSTHTLWMREHNRIARELKKLHRTWDDERLFQETRRIVGAFFQKITYADWLPIILGHNLMLKYALSIPSGLRYFYGYNDRYQASIFNAFATAAYRVGHTFINKSFKRCSKTWDQNGYTPLTTGDHYFNSKAMYDKAQGGADSVLRGLLMTRCQAFDRYMTTEVTERLFESVVDGVKESLDLASLNIQRGRDHGLPGYMAFRRYCRLKVVGRISDLPDHDSAARRALAKVYDSPDDIDLFSGGVSETALPGANVGPTFGCLLAIQFRRLKFGDRFYFENKPRRYNGGGGTQIEGFSIAELREIRKMTYSRALCNNVPVTTIQPNAFKEHTVRGNQRVSCSRIPSPDLSVFDSKGRNVYTNRYRSHPSKSRTKSRYKSGSRSSKSRSKYRTKYRSRSKSSYHRRNRHRYRHRHGSDSE